MTRMSRSSKSTPRQISPTSAQRVAPMGHKPYKSSAVAEMGDRLATNMGRKVGASVLDG